MIAINETLFNKGIITESERNQALIEIDEMCNTKEIKASHSA